MSFKTLLHPALYVMNKLSFKTKIIASISLLFLLLLLPSKTLYTDYIDKNNRYNTQLIGLKYMEAINSYIRTVEEHGTLSLAYIDNRDDQNLIDELHDKEQEFDNQKRAIMNYDENNFKLLNSNFNFARAISQFLIMKQEKFDGITSKKRVYDIHNAIVQKLIETITDISKVSTFSLSKDERITYLSDMIHDKLLTLTAYTWQLRDASVNTLENKLFLKNQRLRLYSFSSELSRLQLHLKENQPLGHISNYHGLDEQTTDVTDKIEKLLLILDTNIMDSKRRVVDNNTFISKVSEAIDSEDALFNMFTYTYIDTINELKSNSQNKLWSLLMTFLGILLAAFYIFIAFYQSITGNLKKLQTASELISMGQTKIKLEVDKQDEIGDALLAFNTMSEKLSENIAFLDGYKTAIDRSSIVSKTDTKGVITYVNKMFCDVSGYTKEELLGRSHNIIRHEDNAKEIFEKMWQTIEDKKIWKGVLKNKNKDGSAYMVNVTILPILDAEDNILEYVAVRHDVTELETSKEEIKKQRTDLLTGLPNRNQLLVDLKVAVKPIIFYLNIDDFSGFNDFYGTSIGDAVLLNLSETLEKLRTTQHFKLYKLQSDQFILLFQEGYLSNKNFQEFFSKLLENIEERILNINLENQNRVSISVTGGVATYYAHDNYQKLILYANIARKKAQESHKKFLLFDHSMSKSEDYAQNIEWIKKIKEAIEENRITTYYQPILDNQTGEIVKYEALVRMLDREGNPVPTWTFLEIAQKAKLYPQITQIVINKAFKTFENLPSFEFSVNLTIDDILSKSTTEFIYEKLENYVNARNVIFEITESEEVNDYKIINEFIKRIKQYGVKIAIDDFGSGYANFEHIINIDADFIKIDGSLIKNINEDKNARIITEAIISFSKKLGRKTITEYVHSEEVYEIVKELGADYSQGFYFGVPSPELAQI
jgi:PAS domain S-box-containing protein